MTDLPIAHFVGGVSTQPDVQKVAGQVTDCDNWFLPIERGATKRNGLLPILTGETHQSLLIVESDEMHYHWIDRDGARRYLVVFSPDAVSPDDVIQVFDIVDGTRMVVNYTANGYSEDPFDYVTVTGGVIKAVTIGDTTIILNTAVTCDDAGNDTAYTFGGTSVDLSANAHYKDDYTEFDQPGTLNDYWYAANDSVGRPAGYYKALGSVAGPKYERVHAREAGWRLKADTMPIRMTYNSGTNEFDVTCTDWAERLSGDTETNPTPEFVGTTLNAMAFHQDRFWLAFEDRCIGSVTSDYWNFWADNWRSIGDSDPVSAGTTGDRVTHIKHMVSFNANLLLFCTGDTQFEIKAAGDGQITPSSIAIIPSTQNSVDHDCVPAKMNDRVFFLSRVSPIKLYEYFYNYDAYNNVAVDVSLHVQGYIPADPVEIRTSDTHNCIVCLCDSDRSKLYVHYSIIAGAEKVQSAWCRWTFEEDDIRSIWIYDSWLYLVIKRGNYYHLDKMYLGEEPVDADMPIASKLDRRIEVTGSYDATTRITTWTLPYLDATMDTLILGGDFGSKAGYARTVTVGSSGGFTTLACTGDYTDGPCWVGRPYEALLGLPRPFYKDQNGRVIPGAMTILGLRAVHTDTGYYQVNVTPYRRETKTHIFNPVRIGSAILGELTIDADGEFNCKPMVSTEDMDISISSSSHLPVTVVSGSYGVRFTRGKRNPAK
jgi:hypothetical protein